MVVSFHILFGYNSAEREEEEVGVESKSASRYLPLECNWISQYYEREILSDFLLHTKLTAEREMKKMKEGTKDKIRQTNRRPHFRYIRGPFFTFKEAKMVWMKDSEFGEREKELDPEASKNSVVFAYCLNLNCIHKKRGSDSFTHS